MSARLVVKTTGGVDINGFISSVFEGMDLSAWKMAQFEPAYIALTGLDGNRFNFKGDFLYADPARAEHDNFLGGTVGVITLVKNPGYKIQTIINTGQVDVVPLLDILMAGNVDGFLNLLGSIDFAGGSGNDSIRSGGADDVLLGNAGSDKLAGMGGNDRIEGGGGIDDLSGGDGDDIIQGGPGADRMSGGLGIDTLTYQDSTGAVSVSLEGFGAQADAKGDMFSGFENLTGSIFNDVLSGNSQDNVILGGSGDDRLAGGEGADVLDGGGGIDTADYSMAGSAVSVDLSTGTGGSTRDTLINIENVIGSTGNDRITGNNAANLLSGRDGDDEISGGKNDDHIEGGRGNDRIAGDAGNDVLYGQAGADVFVILDFEATADRIMDFDARFDKLEVSAALFGGGLVAGNVLGKAEVEVNTTGLASTKDVRFILNSLTGDLHFDINGLTGGANGSRVVAHLSGNLNAFDGNDFLIV